MTQPFQPSFDLDVQEDANLGDFTSIGYQAIVMATQKLCQGELPEIFIYGKRGVGKTHLALAIYNEYVKDGKTAINLSLGDLIATEGDDISALTGLHLFDLIILDDVDKVAKSAEWQEGLFHLINQLRQHQKQVVFLANNPARELDIELLDLVTRLSLAPSFGLPDGSHALDRQAVLSAILKRKNWRLPPVIFEYLVDKGPYNAHDILSVVESISPLLTHLTRPQVSKKTLEQAKQLIDKETLYLEIGEYMNDLDHLNLEP